MSNDEVTIVLTREEAKKLLAGLISLGMVLHPNLKEVKLEIDNLVKKIKEQTGIRTKGEENEKTS